MNEKIKQIDLSDSSIKQISDFLTSVYDDKKKFNYDYLSWLYRDNPDGEIIGFNAFDKDNNIISHYALLPKLANFQNKNPVCRSYGKTYPRRKHLLVRSALFCR